MTRWPVQIAALALFSVLVNASIGSIYGIPRPGVHDEFAYLLMADTFSEGRLTNPTHPMWPHFETYHVFHRPSYQAKYPPAQGMFLALGQLLGGLPILGVWASLALLCAATAWMLAAIVPRPWALLGGILLAANPHVTGWWGQSYWGGAVAALGGTLLFGAVLRFRVRLAVRDAIVLAVGVALLANTRPFEGALAFLAAAPLIIFASIRWLGGDDGKWLVRRFVLPLCACMLPIAVWMLYYNYRLTGEFFTLPYFNWHPEASPIESIRSYKGPAGSSEGYNIGNKLGRLGIFFIAPPILFVSLLGLRSIARDSRTRFCLLVILLVAGIAARFTDAFPHYVAPVTCLVFAVLVQGLRSLAAWKLRGRPLGVILVSIVLVVCLCWDALYMKQMLQEGPLKGALPSPRHWDAAFEAPAMMRDSMIQKLEEQPRKDLILVQYESTRYVDRFEWVYNRADIDAAEVVWARKLSEPENERLLTHFADRRVWLLDPTARPLRLRSLR